MTKFHCRITQTHQWQCHARASWRWQFSGVQDQC